jgi:hypothetical protein
MSNWTIGICGNDSRRADLLRDGKPVGRVVKLSVKGDWGWHALALHGPGDFFAEAGIEINSASIFNIPRLVADAEKQIEEDIRELAEAAFKKIEESQRAAAVMASPIESSKSKLNSLPLSELANISPGREGNSAVRLRVLGMGTLRPMSDDIWHIQLHRKKGECLEVVLEERIRVHEGTNVREEWIPIVPYSREF